MGRSLSVGKNRREETGSEAIPVAERGQRKTPPRGSPSTGFIFSSNRVAAISRNRFFQSRLN